MTQTTQTALQGIAIADTDAAAAGFPNGGLQQNPVMFFRGAATYPGPYRVTEQALRGTYQTTADRFGSTQVQFPGGVFTVRDVQYPLPGSAVGIRALPVNDAGTVTAPDGRQVPGSQLIDDLLRQDGGLGAQDPVYALIAYAWIRMSTGTIPQLLTQGSRNELAFTHMGAYLGGGRTSNAPYAYHSRRWEVGGYPAHVTVLSLDGVEQRLLNRNAHLADAILNDGVVFPPDYTRALFRCIDLNTTLMFYRDWILGARYLRDDDTWATYCSSHKTIVANVLLNVPHNEDAFLETFGDAGPATWAAFKERFARLSGRPFTQGDETRFVPLWKREGYGAQQVRPWRSKDEYDVYNRFRVEGKLNEYTGFRPLAMGAAMAWAPFTIADYVHYVMEAYFDFPDVGGIVASGALYGLLPDTVERMQITPDRYVQLMMPVSQKLMVADAMVRAPGDPQYLAKAYAGLYAAFGGTGDPGDFRRTEESARAFQAYLDPAFGGVPAPDVLAREALALATEMMPQILRDGAQPVDVAYRWFLIAVFPDFQRARDQLVGSVTAIQFYSPPPVAHLGNIGMHPLNPRVTIREIATAMQYDELSLPRAEAAAEVEDDATALPRLEAAPAAPAVRAFREMAPETAGATARAILRDLASPGYYRDPELLARFLASRAPSLAEADARELAGHVLAAAARDEGGAEAPLAALLRERGLR